MNQDAKVAFICPNCSHPAGDNYCAHCGQATKLHDERFIGMIWHFVGHYLHYDGKFRQTIKTLVTAPGALTLAYKNKQRRRFVSPASLYIFIIIASFLFTSVCSQVYVAVGWEQPFREKELVITGGRVTLKDLGEAMESKYIAEKMDAYGPKMFFLLVPFFALILQLFVFRIKAFRFTDQVIFAIHIHCFFFLSMMLADLIPEIVPWGEYVFLGLLAVNAFYLFKALRRVYGLRLLPAVLVTGLAGFLYMLVFFAAFFAVIYMLLLQSAH